MKMIGAFAVGVVAAVAAMVVLGPRVGWTAQEPKNQPWAAQMDVNRPEDLPVCYARGTDSIARATTPAVGPANLDSTAGLADPNFKLGYEFYKQCFTKDFSFTASSRGVVSRTVPDPSTRTPQTDAALQWANYVNNAFRGPGYNYTQHLMGSISAHVTGDKAVDQNYLVATHFFGPASGRKGANVVYGTYTDEDVKVSGKWRIRHRTLDSMASVLIGQ